MEAVNNSTNWNSMSNQAIVTELGANLRHIRVSQKLTQEKLARQAGLSRSAIYELENGKTATSLITIVQVLRVLQQLQIFDSWKQEKPERKLSIFKTKVKAGLRAKMKITQLKKEENEWEWL